MRLQVRVATRRKEDRLNLYGTRVIFRTGNPINEHDLVSNAEHAHTHTHSLSAFL